MMDFRRDELGALINRANEQVKLNGHNTEWQNAYTRVRDALDCLDAMMARSASKVVE